MCQQMYPYYKPLNDIYYNDNTEAQRGSVMWQRVGLSIQALAGSVMLAQIFLAVHFLASWRVVVLDLCIGRADETPSGE